MGRSNNENNPSLFASSANFQEPRTRGGQALVKDMVPNQRRALRSIDQNIIGNHAIVGKNVSFGHRPITRALSAQQSDREHQHCLEQNKVSTTLALRPSGSDNFYELNEDGTDDTIPMFVKHTEAMLDEIDKMEVEMEDIEADSVVDIDKSSLLDPLSVVEYVDDLYAHYRKIEGSSCVSPNYMDHQSDVNDKMRAILIDWLIEVHYKFELMGETLFLTVNLIDRFLERQMMVRKKLQLVGVTAMLLASKYEEVSVPLVNDFVHITDKAYTRKQILDMENLMLKTLQYNMSVPTPFVFMKRFLKAAQCDRKLELMSFFIIELCLVEYEMLKFPPSVLAAAAIYTAQCSLCRFKQWTKTYEWYTNYTEHQLLECSRLMVSLHEKAGTGKLSGVHRKYSTTKFGCAAKAEPAWFLY